MTARLAIFGATLLVAMFLAAFDQAVVGTALPRIGGRHLEALFRFQAGIRHLAISQD